MTSNPENNRPLTLNNKIVLEEDKIPSMQKITMKFITVVFIISGIMGIVWSWLVY